MPGAWVPGFILTLLFGLLSSLQRVSAYKVSKTSEPFLPALPWREFLVTTDRQLATSFLFCLGKVEVGTSEGGSGETWVASLGRVVLVGLCC